jgi:hypothetical protein
VNQSSGHRPRGGYCVQDGIQARRRTGPVGEAPAVHIDKRPPYYSDGFEHRLEPSAHFYKRRFDFADLNKAGWAIVFQTLPPDEDSTSERTAEYFAAWVPPDREADADRWIAFLNAEILDRLDRADGTVIDDADVDHP